MDFDALGTIAWWVLAIPIWVFAAVFLFVMIAVPLAMGTATTIVLALHVVVAPIIYVSERVHAWWNKPRVW